ncbi:2896_t:CDS:2, partial [Cetraspora pellucida]
MEDSTASPNDIIPSISTQSEIGKEIVGNTYHTKDHWMATYSINISRTYLKEHTLSCSSSPICKTHGDVFKQITKEEIDKSIVDLVVRIGISFSILDNPLFHKITRNLHYVINSYKNILAKTSGWISLTCDRWHSTVHKCHYIVITGSWISDDWKIVNIILNFQKSGQTAEEILSVIKDTLEKYSIENKIFTLTMNNTTTNKAVTWLFQNKLPNKELISIANPLASGRLDVLESYCQISRIKFLQPILEIDIVSDDEELINLIFFCKLLKPFEKAMLVLSKEESNSISNAIVVILEIGQHIRKATMIHQMKKKFDKYWNIIIDHVIIAHVLDLRYKLEHLKATLIEVGRYSENKAELFVNDIWQKIIYYRMKYTSAESLPAKTIEAIEINDDYPTSNNFLFLRRRMSNKRKYAKYANTIESELEQYESKSPEGELLEEFITDNERNGILYWES